MEISNRTNAVNYNRIAQAIEYIQDNFKHQPSLAEIANHINLSQAHFQRLFTEWAGVSPKKFLQYISIEHAKSVLKRNAYNDVFDATFDTGLSSTSRLHDLFVQIEGMTPSEYKNGGANLKINYSFADTLFGAVIIASTRKGICYMAFFDDKSDALNSLYAQFPNAEFLEFRDELQNNALLAFSSYNPDLTELKLHLKGTEFQIKVWESLLKIPKGGLTTYGEIAKNIGNDNASRAVGTAIGSNPVAFLIPCHRVIQATGGLGGYRWGKPRKASIIGWEGVHSNVAA